MTAADLISRAEAYAVRAGLKQSTVSRKLLGSGAELDRLRNGGSALERTLKRAHAKLDELEAALNARAA